MKYACLTGCEWQIFYNYMIYFQYKCIVKITQKVHKTYKLALERSL